jgi:hypothetical protein
MSVTTVEEIKQPERLKLRDIMGPGLITGASDGIVTLTRSGLGSRIRRD